MATELTTLPVFLRSERSKYVAYFITLLIGQSLYLVVNHFPIFPEHLLPLTALDSAVPFVPQTVWIYNSDLILFLVAYAFSKDLVNANRFLYSVFALLLFSVAIFFVWPTTYPRALFPLPSTLDPWTAAFFTSLRNIDAPSNCFPSLHVSVSYLSAFIYLGEQKEKFPFFITWATLVAISTLTTKQHYIADVVSGFGLAVMMYFIFRRFIQYRNPQFS